MYDSNLRIMEQLILLYSDDRYAPAQLKGHFSLPLSSSIAESNPRVIVEV